MPTPSPDLRRAPARALVWLVVALGLLGAAVPFAGRAEAHATLVGSTPGNDEVVPTRPAEVVLRFDQPVRVQPNGVAVVDPRGGESQRGEPTTSGGGRVVTQPLADAGPAGTYTVSYRVLSEDGHVISGSWVFHVERRTGSAEAVDDTSTAGRVLEAAGRWLAFSAALLAGGVLAMALLVDRTGGRWSAGLPAARRLLLPAAALTLFGTGLLLLGSATDLAGGSLGDGLGALDDVLGSGRSGAVVGLRLVVALVLLVAVAGAPLLQRVPWLAAVGILATLALPSFGGHASTASPAALAVAADVVHVLAAAAWAGGLAVLVLTWDGSRDRLGRFSSTALIAAPVVILTGAVGGWIHTRSLDALTGTEYGQLVLAKFAGAVVMLVFGFLARRGLRATDRPVNRLLGGLRAEALVALGVVAVTAVLVATPPGVEAASQPFEAVRQAGDTTIRFQVEPARSGPNTVHLYYLARDGSLAAVDAAELEVSTRGIEPRRVPVTPITVSHGTVTGLQLTPGRWRMQVTIVSKGVPASTTFEVPIR